MHATKYTHLLASLFVAAAVTGCSSNEKPKEAAAPPPPPAPTQPPPPLTVERSAEITLTAKVKAINYTTREVTLQDYSGHEVTFIADQRVRRLNEVKVGDEVNADYYVSLQGELRPATADEMAHPISAVEISGRAPMSQEPGAASARAVKVVTTVQAVDLASMLVTLRGPMGDRVVIHARNPDNVKRLHVGDTVVLTYTEAVAVTLDKRGMNE